MNLYRTSESGLVAVQPLDPSESEGLADALVQGAGAPLGDDDLLFVTTDVDDGVATALALDAGGDLVVVGAADSQIDTGAVTRALQRASATADSDYDALEADFAGGETLREAHADYFDRDPLAPEAFNDDQRVRLVAPAFDDDALELAAFLSDRDVAVDAVRVEAFGDPESRSYLVRFDAVDGDAVPGEGEAVSDEPSSEGPSKDESAAEELPSEDSQQWVAGASAAAASDAAAQGSSGEADKGGPEPPRADGSAASGGHESALTASGGSDTETTDDAATTSGAETMGDATTTSDDETASDAEAQDGTGNAADTEAASDDEEPDETLELPVLLNAVAEGLGERLVGTFDEATDDLLSVERGTELLARPDHPAYAGGVLRYRLRAESDGTVEFAVSIYGGSEAEKEQMRAVVRQNEEPIETELGYDVAEGYDGFSSSREFARFDQVAAAEIVDEFDRLVRFFHPRVMRA